MRRVQRIILSALFLVLAYNLSAAAAAEDGPYPVWWSPVLELDSLDAIDARLERKLWEGDSEGMPLIKSNQGIRIEAWAGTCASLKMLTAKGYYGLGSNGIWAQHHHLARCRAIEMLRQARHAQLSYLRDFDLNAESLNFLPAMVDHTPSCDFTCRQQLANQRGIPFAQFELIISVDVRSEIEMDIGIEGWDLRLTIVGRGDFNDDGLDDMLLLSNTNATRGSWGGAKIFLLTRKSPDTVLHVLGANQHLCPGYMCRDEYDRPEALRIPEPEAAN